MAVVTFFELFLITPQGTVLYCKANCEQYRHMPLNLRFAIMEGVSVCNLE